MKLIKPAVKPANPVIKRDFNQPPDDDEPLLRMFVLETLSGVCAIFSTVLELFSIGLMRVSCSSIISSEILFTRTSIFALDDNNF